MIDERALYTRYTSTPYAKALSLSAACVFPRLHPGARLSAYINTPAYPYCRRCRKRADHVRLEEFFHRQSVRVTVCCHGEVEVVEVSYPLIMDGGWPPNAANYYAFGPAVEVGTLGMEDEAAAVRNDTEV